MTFLLVLNPPPPILRLNIAYFAVAEGWLLLDIGWFVLFLNHILIFMQKRCLTPKKSKKSMSVFFRHVTSFFHRRVYATVFLCFIAGECHGSVNIIIFYYCFLYVGKANKVKVWECVVCLNDFWFEYTWISLICLSAISWSLNF